MHAISSTDSLREAAVQLHLHHSTLHSRVLRAQRLLGWDLQTQSGKQRTHLALVVRRLLTANQPRVRVG